MLQFVNTFIDSVQDAKLQWIKTFVKDESLAKPITAFVESQRAFSKQVAKTTFDVSLETAVQAVKFDAKKVFAIK